MKAVLVLEWDLEPEQEESVHDWQQSVQLVVNLVKDMVDAPPVQGYLGVGPSAEMVLCVFVDGN